MVKSQKKQAYKRGLWAENIAALYLFFKGYRILAKRYKTPVGELDLVAFKKDTLIVVEVKSRTYMEDALQAITPRAQKRIEKAAQYFLAKRPDFVSCSVRFDVVALGRSKPWVFSLKHLDNAWQARA